MIPKIIHYVYGLQSDFGGKPFSFVHWAAIQSAVKLNPDYQHILWYSFLPDNYLFEDVRQLLEIRKIEPPEEIHGAALSHYAHKADVIRLQVLNDLGGFYLDLDTITVRSLDSLLDNQFVIASERANGVDIGLCNAIMGCEPNSQFAAAWIDSYSSFRSKGRDQYWNEHSVKIPLQLSRLYPNLLTVLEPDTFLIPDWTQKGLEDLFINSLEYPNAYIHHLWESCSWGALKSFNEFNVESIDSSYTKLLRSILSEEISHLKASRVNWIKQEFDASLAKANLGCGVNRDLDYVNCDMHPESGADIVFDLTSQSWPIPTSSCCLIRLHHVLEHISGDLSTFFKELYRISANGADIEIAVPHPRHNWFYEDPTHSKGWLAESFSFLDRKISLQRFFSGDAKTPLALYWNVDFEIKEAQITLDKSTMDSLGKSFSNSLSTDEAYKFLNNIAGEIRVRLKARK